MATVSTVPIGVVINDAASSGSHFFDKAALRFFRSRLPKTAVKVEVDFVTFYVFVTSEQFVGSDGVADARKFTVRVRQSGQASGWCAVNEPVELEFQRYASSREAAVGVKAIAASIVEYGIPFTGVTS